MSYHHLTVTMFAKHLKSLLICSSALVHLNTVYIVSYRCAHYYYPWQTQAYFLQSRCFFTVA